MNSDRMTSIIAKTIVILIVLPITALLLMFLWTWTIPDVFAGLVENNTLPATISFEQSLKLIALFSALGAGTGLGFLFTGKSK